MKKKFAILVISALFVLLGFYVYSAFHEKSALERDTILYLEEQGYDRNEDIIALEVVNMGDNDSVVVTFKDEPSVDYFYGYKESSNEIHKIDEVEKENNNRTG